MERYRDLELLVSSFDMVLDHSEAIMERAAWFFCEPQGAFIAAAWVPGARLSVGVLLRLYGAGKWLQCCSTCYGILYVVGARGSVMSGYHTCWGVCRKCRLQYAESRSFLHDLYKPAMKLIEIYDNRPIITHPNPQPWSWVKAPAYVPEPIPRRPIDAVNLEELVENLKLFEQFKNDSNGKDGNRI